MPRYDYKCKCGHKFEEYHRIDDRHNAFCPVCKIPANLVVSPVNFRFAEPITLYQELSGGRGFQEIGWKADSGISPRPGRPYKTQHDIEMEEAGAITEV